jgi:hypothetical protein
MSADRPGGSHRPPGFSFPNQGQQPYVGHTGNRVDVRELVSCRLGGPTGGNPAMDQRTRTEIWDLAAGTFIAVSVVSSLAYMIVSVI